MKKKKTFDFCEVPSNWRLCFNRDCPRCEGCLRYVAGCHAPADLEWGQAIYPKALQPDGQCHWFRTAEPQPVAWGFAHIFDHVQRLDFKPMRLRITEILGSKGAYYEYRNGVRPLMAEHQQAIAQVFEKYGYEPPQYEKSSLCYDFR